MELNDHVNKPFFSGLIMQVILKYKKHLAVIGVVAVIAAVIFSSPYFIKPLYKSTVILYPTASNSISKVLLSDNPGNNKDILEFGEDEQTEQMLQILNSNKIRDRIIEKYGFKMKEIDKLGILNSLEQRFHSVFIDLQNVLTAGSETELINLIESKKFDYYIIIYNKEEELEKFPLDRAVKLEKPFNKEKVEKLIEEIII